MRTKDEINKFLIDEDAWSDGDYSRKAHQLDILIEVLIDIRDVLKAKSDNLKAAKLDNETVKLIHSDKG